MDYDPMLGENINLITCRDPTQGFLWFHLLLVTELMIFSVRAPGYFVTSMPSPYLLGSILITLLAGGLIACLALKMALMDVGWIVLFNVASFILVDIVKVEFRKLIGENPGDIIATDDLLEPPVRTEAQKTLKKNVRYSVHRESILNVEDRNHVILVASTSLLPGIFDFGGELQINGGFVGKRTKMLSELTEMTTNWDK
jgi:hypothetical protein